MLISLSADGILEGMTLLPYFLRMKRGTNTTTAMWDDRNILAFMRYLIDHQAVKQGASGFYACGCLTFAFARYECALCRLFSRHRG